MYLVQKKHSSYDATHDSLRFLRKSLGLLQRNYAGLRAADLLIWHEGDFGPRDLPALNVSKQVNVRFCALDCCSGWGTPPWLRTLHHKVASGAKWAEGYLFMIRMHALRRPNHARLPNVAVWCVHLHVTTYVTTHPSCRRLLAWQVLGDAVAHDA